MRQRVAIAISSLVAAAVLAVGLTAAGFGPAPQAALGEEAELAVTDATVDVAEPDEITEPEVIYVKPAPKPKTVVVKKRVKQQPASSSGSASRKVVRASRSHDDDDRAEHRREREHEHEHEREDDDD